MRCVCISECGVYLCRGCVCSGHNTSTAKSYTWSLFHLNIPGTMLHYCLHICRGFFWNYIDSPLNRCVTVSTCAVSYFCFTVVEHRSGVQCVVQQALEAAARPRSRSECAPFPQALIRAHCGDAPLLVWQVTWRHRLLLLWFHTSLGSSFSVNCFDLSQLPTAFSTGSSRRKVLEHSPAGCSGSSPSQNLQKW